MDKGGIPDAFPNLKNFPQLKHIETSPNHATSNKSRHFLSDGLMHHIVISPEAVAQFWIRGTEKLPYHCTAYCQSGKFLELSWAVLISSSVLSGTSENLAGSLCLPICKTKENLQCSMDRTFPACKINGTSNFIGLPLQLCERNDIHFLWYSMCIDVHTCIYFGIHFWLFLQNPLAQGNLKMMVTKRNLLFQGLIFRFHVKFQGCKHLIFQRQNFLRTWAWPIYGWLSPSCPCQKACSQRQSSRDPVV